MHTQSLTHATASKPIATARKQRRQRERANNPGFWWGRARNECLSQRRTSAIWNTRIYLKDTRIWFKLKVKILLGYIPNY